MTTKAALRRAEREKRADAELELSGLRNSLDEAYAVFNNTTDPELLEACILEIRALQSRYGHALKHLKLL